MPENAPCTDCGISTACVPPVEGTWEWYMVREEVWVAAGMPPSTRMHEDGDWTNDGEGFLCLGCIEARLGRVLTVDDLLDAPINSMPSDLDTDRMYALKEAYRAR